jgi:hypothetical protein
MRGIASRAVILGRAQRSCSPPSRVCLSSDRVAHPVRLVKTAPSFPMPTSFKAVAHRKESWLRKSEPRDKWSFRLKAAGMRAAQERPDETIPAEPTRTSLQGEGGDGRCLRRQDAGRVGSAVRHSCQPDHPVEGPASKRGCRACSTPRPWDQSCFPHQVARTHHLTWPTKPR